MKKFLFILLLLACCVSGGMFWAYWQINEFVKQPVKVKEEQLLTVSRGTTGNKLATLLENEGLIENGKWLPWLLKLKPELNKIKAGTYSLANVKNIRDLLDILNQGKEAQFNVQFIEGQRFQHWRKNLEKAPHLQQTLQGKSEQEIFALLDLPDYSKAIHEWKNLDGWLYPDTYSYTPNSTDLALLKRVAARTIKALDQAWQQREANLPLKDPYEMLILASIVEKETALSKERAKVAGVFVNRLNKQMKLQTDPTVIYGMGDEYKGNIRKKDLLTPTPYNTYVIDGLPPTPIAMVSEESLLAVAKPEQHDYLYFVADGNGGHKFSKTLAEHNRAVQEYLRWYRSQSK